MRLSIMNFLWSILLLLSLPQRPVFATMKQYIVKLGMHPHSKEGRRLAVDPDIVERSHHELLSSFLPSGTKTKERMIHSYNKVIDGFAATLDEDEVEKLKKHHHVISVFESEIMQPQTTRSWDFLGFEHNEVIAEESLWQKTNFGEDLIIANLDTGVWPEARSFSDENYGPIPKRFKGECENENDAGFRCNKKLIGARYFYEGCADTMKTSKNETFNATKSPRDDNCHGTHTLATAAGNFVKGANFRGFGNGTAKGGAPRARVAAYKVCWSECGCVTSDVMAAFESAITDGVDIISFSMGGGSQDRSVDYFKNGNAVASFFAVKHGVLVVASAGNVGDLGPSTVTNISPWFLTVGAGSSDRDFSCRATLGDKRTFRGDSITNITTLPNSFYPLITGSQAVLPGANSTRSLLCTPGSLDPMKVKGKILVCQHTLSDGIDKDGRAEAAGEAGAVGLILANDEHNPFATLIYFNPIPVSHMSYPDGQAVFDYIKSTKDPIASLTSPALTELGVKPAPVMGYFSSRGPNNLTAAILKPDLIAPGINILAAWSEHPKAFMTPTPFKFSTGTSMATPHVAGIAALLKKLHPQWSPSAIKSALMTTATNVDNTGKPIREMNMSEATPFAYGSGQVRASLAADPGLVYDMNENDYLNFLCAIGYNATMIERFSLSNNTYQCPKSASIADFNYPSIAIPDFTGTATITRRLKNVGKPSTYTARLEAPHGISIVVEPKTLIFNQLDQELTYKLVFTAPTNNLPKDYIFGNLIWSDGAHIVRSPIVIKGKTIS